jgi:hypothetical protein
LRPCAGVSSKPEELEKRLVDLTGSQAARVKKVIKEAGQR